MVYSGVNIVVGFPLTEKYLASFIPDEDELNDWGRNRSCKEIIDDGYENEIPDELVKVFNGNDVMCFDVPHGVADDGMLDDQIYRVVGIAISSYDTDMDMVSDSYHTDLFSITKMVNSKAKKNAEKYIKTLAPEFASKVEVFFIPMDCSCCS